MKGDKGEEGLPGLPGQVFIAQVATYYYLNYPRRLTLCRSRGYVGARPSVCLSLCL